MSHTLPPMSISPGRFRESPSLSVPLIQLLPSILAYIQNRLVDQRMPHDLSIMKYQVQAFLHELLSPYIQDDDVTISLNKNTNYDLSIGFQFRNELVGNKAIPVNLGKTMDHETLFEVFKRVSPPPPPVLPDHLDEVRERITTFTLAAETPGSRKEEITSSASYYRIHVTSRYFDKYSIHHGIANRVDLTRSQVRVNKGDLVSLPTEIMMIENNPNNLSFQVKQNFEEGTVLHFYLVSA